MEFYFVVVLVIAYRWVWARLHIMFNLDFGLCIFICFLYIERGHPTVLMEISLVPAAVSLGTVIEAGIGTSGRFPARANSRFEGGQFSLGL